MSIREGVYKSGYYSTSIDIWSSTESKKVPSPAYSAPIPLQHAPAPCPFLRPRALAEASRTADMVNDDDGRKWIEEEEGWRGIMP